MLIKGKILSSNLIGENKTKPKNTGLNAVIFGRSENKYQGEQSQQGKNMHSEFETCMAK